MSVATEAREPSRQGLPLIGNPLRWATGQNRRNLWGFASCMPIVLLAVSCALPAHPGPARSGPGVRLQAPSVQHPFGTDALGRDVLSRTLGGARISLLVGLCAAGLALFVGIFLGIMSGFMGRVVDGAS
jgi:peptide/nickel transport system permease protein